MYEFEVFMDTMLTIFSTVVYADKKKQSNISSI